MRYHDLGCGICCGVALLAARSHKGRFMGGDFNLYHIAHGRSLARRLALTNLVFHETDLLDLQRDFVQP